MTSAAPPTCPKCQSALQAGTNFCGNCGALISGVWGSRTEMFGSTVAVQVTDSTDTLAELLTRATLGEYDIYGELGRGGMAAVYLALDLSLNRKVAIKTMLPDLVVKTDMVERFKREAQTAAALSHPHVIQIFAVKQTPEMVYFVMKYIEGRSLESIAAETGPMPLGTAQVVLSQVASALAYAHRKGVIHRDVKPANVMIDEDGWAIVTDFGIAKVQVAQNLTATGTAIGTPTYMSPEQFHNKAITGASDQYSLGVVAYEILTGKKPFDGATYAEIITQHLFEPVPDMRKLRPDLPEHVTAVVNRMLSKDPAQRYADLDAAAVALGSPDKAEGERIRTEMISLAKTGPRRTVRMSVPVSPIPMTKKETSAAPGGAATVVAGGSPAARTVPQRPASAAPKPRPKPDTVAIPTAKLRLWGSVAAVALVVAAALGVWKAMSPDKPASGQQVTSPTVGQSTTAVPTPPTTTAAADSTPTAPSGNQPTGTGTRPPVDAPAPARITVADAPSNAVITLDGRRQSGRQFSARAGTHQVRIEAAGFQPMTRSIKVAAGEQVPITFDRRVAETAPPVGNPVSSQGSAQPAQGGLARMQIIVQPPATISIDGASKGEQSRLQEEVVPGTHTVRAEKAGFISKDTVITILAGQTARVLLQLTARP